MRAGSDIGVDARLELLGRALAQNPNDPDLLFRLADALADAGDADRYAESFRSAFRLKPSVQPRLGESAVALRDRARMLIERGVAYAPVIGGLAVAEALLGHRAEVERLVDHRSFLRIETLSALDGVADALMSGAVRRERQGGKAGDGRYVFDVFGMPALRRVADEVRAHVERYIAALGASDHPFVASAPKSYRLSAWSVQSDGDDHFEPHIHPQAWASGVLYVLQPPVSRESERGWLRIGPPSQFGVTAEQGWSERRIEPKPGRLVLMPGYFYHETLPTHAAETRLCVAFNVVPAELA
jgi:putative 2-oxoglutarate-Fe(II)-dependent oxygenase superfamily protein